MAKALAIPVRVTAVDDTSRVLKATAHRINSSLAKVGIGIAKVGAAAAVATVASAVAIGAALYKIVDDYASTGEEIGRFARQVGMSVESLQEFRYAAEAMFGNADIMNNALEKFTKNIGDMRLGTGQLVGTLKDTDRAFLKQLKSTKSVEEAFVLYLDKLAETKDPTRRAALASLAFGKGLSKIMQLVDGGSEKLKELREEARKYGIMTEEDIAATEAFDDAMDHLNAAIGAVKRVIGAQLVPVLSPMIEGMSEWIIANREFIQLKFAEYVGKIRDALVKISDWAKIEAPRMWEQVKADIAAVSAAIGWLKDNMSTIKTVIIGIGAAWTGINLVVGINAAVTAVGLLRASAVGLGAAAAPVLAIAAAFAAVTVAAMTALDAIDAYYGYADAKENNKDITKDVDAYAARTAETRGITVEEFNRLVSTHSKYPRNLMKDAKALGIPTAGRKYSEIEADIGAKRSEFAGQSWGNSPWQAPIPGDSINITVNNAVPGTTVEADRASGKPVKKNIRQRNTAYAPARR